MKGIHTLLPLDCMWVLIGVGNAQKRGDTDHHTENAIARKMFYMVKFKLSTPYFTSSFIIDGCWVPDALAMRRLVASDQQVEWQRRPCSEPKSYVSIHEDPQNVNYC